MTPEQILIAGLTTVSAVVVCLAGVVAFLFRLLMKHKRECDSDRARLTSEILKQKDHIIDIYKTLGTQPKDTPKA